MKRSTALGICGLVGVILWFLVARGQPAQPASGSVVEQPYQLILDAGHGGEDGGAVSLTGVPESRINLAIVQKMDELLGFYGSPPILIRNEDRSLHEEGAVTLREKKVSDLNYRVNLVNETDRGVLISVHQNSYPSPKYQGTQVFYAPTDGSSQLAHHIQTAIQRTIQPENARETKKITENVYLMNHIDRTAVLVECGFLTNPEEEAKLRDDTYQTQLAAVLTAAWLTSISV